MRRLSLISVVTILMGGLVFTNCKDQKKEESSKNQKEPDPQEVFEENLQSYPENFEDFVGEVVKDFEFSEKAKLGKVELEKGMEITYKKSGEDFSGKLPEDVYGLMKDGKILLNDLRVTKQGEAPMNEFSVEPFKSAWTKDELDPLLRKYPMTVYINGNKRRGSIKSYENFEDIYDPDNDLSFVVETEEDYYLVWKGDEPYLVNKSGEFWDER